MPPIQPFFFGWISLHVSFIYPCGTIRFWVEILFWSTCMIARSSPICSKKGRNLRLPTLGCMYNIKEGQSLGPVTRSLVETRAWGVFRHRDKLTGFKTMTIFKLYYYFLGIILFLLFVVFQILKHCKHCLVTFYLWSFSLWPFLPVNILLWLVLHLTFFYLWLYYLQPKSRQVNSFVKKVLNSDIPNKKFVRKTLF